MDSFQKNVIAILRAALTGTPSEISPDFDLERAAGIAKKHSIAAMFYYGALTCGISAEGTIMKELFSEACNALVISERQQYEIKMLEEKFEEGKIDFLPLKGIVLKDIYPKHEMRTMGDADILIRLEQYPKIEGILTNLGFQFRDETDHELVWTKKTLMLELHKNVMTSFNKDFYQYYQNCWEFARKSSASSSRYELKSEDFFIYLFVHFTKHYRISGIGIKHIIDFWVYKNAHPAMDEAYMIGELNKLHLYEFYLNIMSTLEAWFQNTGSNDKTDYITSFIFSGGQYGTDEMAVVNRMIRDSKKTDSVSKLRQKRVIKVVFPPYRSMCKKYPVLKKAPILLPLMWCVRIVSTLCSDRKKLKKYIRMLLTK